MESASKRQKTGLSSMHLIQAQYQPYPSLSPSSMSETCPFPGQVSPSNHGHSTSGRIETPGIPSPPTPQLAQQTESICFGMLCFDLKGAEICQDELPLAVGLMGTGRLLSQHSGAQIAALEPRDCEITDVLMREGVELEAVLTQLTSQTNRCEPCALQAMLTLYGSADLLSSLQQFLLDCDLYLQDPVYARRDAFYRNPQLFRNEARWKTSHFWAAADHSHGSRSVHVSPVDFLSGFTSDIDLPETQGSKYLQTNLQSHQRRALTFMVNREHGWDLLTAGRDIWSLSTGQLGGHTYVNNIDSTTHRDPPPPFEGGVLADGMGSGKTLSMIALIAHDKSNMCNGLRQNSDNCTSLAKACTLIVMPPHVLRTWQEELARHLSRQGFSWQCHHGAAKVTGMADLASTDIVLVTYATLASEWRNNPAGFLFQCEWQRVILDEAHHIKDPATTTSKAAMSLKASKRWAVSGTPIQNRLSELGSLLRFIGAFPYSDRKTFDDHITQLWISGEGQKAIDRLKRILNFIMLRRPQKDLNLPRRTDLKIFVDFDDHERLFYDDAKMKAVQSIDDLANSDRRGNDYLNAFQKINVLRRISTLGTSEAPEHRSVPSWSSSHVEVGSTWDVDTAREALLALPMTGVPIACVNCATPVDLSLGPSEEITSVRISKCLQILCSACDENKPAHLEVQCCPCKPLCPSVTVTLETQTVLSTPDFRRSKNRTYPTKVRKLVQDLNQHAVNEKSVVFSSWTATLDLAGAALQDTGIRYVQVDGRVRPKRRGQLFQDFTEHEDIRVLLLSLSCGASGLTLTAASRVYLMEPQWNPSTEEQALARVYRIGQTRDVTTVRYITDKSIENYVLSIQDGKTDLVTALLAAPGSSSKTIERERLLELMKLL